MLRAFLLCFGLSLIAFPLNGIAAEITATSKILSVTVFPNGAQVAREFTVDLPNGDHEVVISDLPPELQKRSLRIDGQGSSGLVIGSIDQKVVTLPLADGSNSALLIQLKDELQGLIDERVLLQAHVKASELQTKLLNEMALLPSRPMSRGRSDGGVDLSQQYSNLYALMGDKYVEAQARALTARVKIRALNKKITNLHHRISEQPRGKKRVTRLKVNVSAETAGSAMFVVRYQVGNAGWRPSYEARLQTGTDAAKAKLALVRRAVIYQRTSEDWDDIKLSLSTTNPLGRVKAPTLWPLLVKFRDENKRKRKASSGYFDDGIVRSETKSERSLKKPGRAQKESDALGLGAVMDAPAVPAPMKVRQANVSMGQFQMTFDVTDRVTVKRSGEEKKVLLDELSIDPKVVIFAVPKLNRKAFLHATFENKTGNALLSGEMALFRDGVYVGNGRLKLVEPGQKAELGFGVDTQVNVKWVRLDRVKGKTGLITSSNSDLHRYKATISNGHKQAILVTVLDQLPYTEHEDLTISLNSSSPQPTRTNVADRRGVMAWDFTLEKGKSKNIDFSYQLVWPKNKTINLK